MLYNDILVHTYSQKTLNKILFSFYTDWKTRYLREVLNTSPKQEYLFYTLDQATANHAVTCSEAMGYGMFIFPMMSCFDSEAKRHFLSLYHFVKSYPSFYNPQLMAWQQIQSANGTIINSTPTTSSATDGDMDISYGLLLAHHLWDKQDAIPYLFEAKLRIQALMESCVNHSDFIILLGDWVTGIKENSFKYVTRSSDFMTYMMKLYRKIDSENSIYWNYVLEQISSVILHQLTKESKTNGLMPDFFVKQGDFYIAPTTQILESPHDGDYYFNSCRIPWRYAMNNIIHHVPVNYQLHLLNHWIKKSTKYNPYNIVSGYYLSNGLPGTGFGSPYDLSFIAPFLVSAVAEPGNDFWIQQLWNVLVSTPMDACNFYENTLRLIALIIATGHWISPIET